MAARRKRQLYWIRIDPMENTGVRVLKKDINNPRYVRLARESGDEVVGIHAWNMWDARQKLGISAPTYKKPAQIDKRQMTLFGGLGHVDAPMIGKMEKILQRFADGVDSAKVEQRFMDAADANQMMYGAHTMTSELGVECGCFKFGEYSRKCLCAQTRMQLKDKASREIPGFRR